MAESSLFPRIFICIPVFNRIDYTVKCIQSIFRQTYTNWHIIICDDGSTDGTFRILRDLFPTVTIEVGTGNLFWTGGTNKCVVKALSMAKDDDLIYTLNNDTELFPDTLETLIKTSTKFPDSLIGTLNLFYENPEKIENSAFLFNKAIGFSRLKKFGEKRNPNDRIIAVDGLAGKGVLVPHEVYKKIGIYHEKLLPHYHADLEFSFRAKKSGYKVLLNCEACLLSHQSQSGLGSITTKPKISEFLKSFWTIRSTHHLPSLIAFSKLIYGRTYLIHLIRNIIFMNLGFVKRWFRYQFMKQ